MKVYNLHEITDSKILYDKNPPKFMIYIIALVLAFLVAFIVWADKSIKTYVVKGQGIVTIENKANIMTSVSGEIEEVLVEEGAKVKEGDILLTLRSVDADLQLSQVNSQIDYLNKRIELLTRAEKDATKLTNSFNRKNSVEVEFYNRLKSSYAQRKEFTASNDESLINQGYSEEQIKQYKEQQKVKLNQLYYQTINSFTTEKSQLKLQKSQYEAQSNLMKKAKVNIK